MCKAVLDVNLVTGNVVVVRNARTNEVVAMASQLRLKAKNRRTNILAV